MDIPVEWLSSQVIFGAVLAILAVVGIVFFFRTRPTPASASSGGDVDDGHGHGHGHGQDHGDEAAHAHDAAVAGDPTPPVTSASVFETEPCWVSLIPGRARTP